MGRKRTNPETGVFEEKAVFGWSAVFNENGCEERINPESGVREEKGIFGWSSKSNHEGREIRTNPESGVREENSWCGWQRSRNENNRETRVNPETGVHEEKDILGWSPVRNSENRETRINPETGVYEEKGILGWSESTHRGGKAAVPRGMPSRAVDRVEEDYRPSRGGYDADDDSVGTMIKLGFIIGIIVGILWLLYQAFMATLMILPVLVFGTFVGMVAAYILASLTVREMDPEAYKKFPLVNLAKQNKAPKLGLDPAAAGNTYSFRVDGMRICAATAILLLAFVAWPMWATPEGVTRILLSVGVVIALILGFIFGEKVLRKRIENLLLKNVEGNKVRYFHSPDMALLLGGLGLLVLVPMWAIILLEVNGRLQWGKELGWINDTAAPTSYSNMALAPPGGQEIHPDGVDSEGREILLTPPSGQTAQSTHHASPEVAEDNELGEKVGVHLVPGLSVVVSKTRGQISLRENWMARFGAVEKKCRISDLDWGSAKLAESPTRGAYAGNPHIVIPLKAGSSYQVSNWGPNPSIENPWLSGTRPDSQKIESAPISLFAKSPQAASELMSMLSMMRFAVDRFPSVPLPPLGSNPAPDQGIDSARAAGTVSANVAEKGNPRDTFNPQVLVHFVRSKLLDDNSGDMKAILARYASQVDYWTHGKVTQEFIAKDKAKYFEAWPMRYEQMTEMKSVDVVSPSSYRLVYTAKFRIENFRKNLATEGVQETTLVVRREGRGFLIEAEKGNVLQRQKIDAGAGSPEGSPVSAAPHPVDGGFAGERFAATRLRVLQKSEVSHLSGDDLRYAINEIYARHGGNFAKPEVRQQFARFPWYRPRTDVTLDQLAKQFSAVERQNLTLLAALRASGRN